MLQALESNLSNRLTSMNQTQANVLTMKQAESIVSQLTLISLSSIKEIAASIRRRDIEITFQCVYLAWVIHTLE